VCVWEFITFLLAVEKMTHSTKLVASDQLLAAFEKAKNDKSVRYLKVNIKEEKLELVLEGKSTGSTGVDFNNLKNVIQPKECCYILFKYKESFEASPWALLSIIPDDASVNERMIYSSTIGRIKELFGHSNFGEDRRFTDPSELNRFNFKGVQGGAITTSEKGNPETHPEKPWSARELAQHQLDMGEMQARREYEQGKQTTGGYHILGLVSKWDSQPRYGKRFGPVHFSHFNTFPV